MGGCGGMGSDDDFLIRQVLQIGSWFCCWAQLSIERIIWVTCLYIHTFGDLGNGG